MNIILTGKNSYISNSLANYLKQKGHNATCVSLRKGVGNLNLKDVDAIIHCAAIVHKKEEKFKNEYDKINYGLTMDLAKRAKPCGVKHFIFLSSMAVYGLEDGEINKDTPLEPKTLYGKSKLKAEKALKEIEDDKFKVTIVRPPLVYGKGCYGNFRSLRKIAKLPILPEIKNKRSVLYVGNLDYLICKIVEGRLGGYFMPMDNEYISTTKIMQILSGSRASKKLGDFVSKFKFKVVKKAFGSLYYGEDIAYKINEIDIYRAVEMSKED